MAPKIKLPAPIPPPSAIDYLKVVGFKWEDNVEEWVDIWVSKGTHPSYASCRVNVDAGTYPAGSLIAHVNGEPDDRFINTVAVVATSAGENVDGVLFRSESGLTVEAPNNQLTQIAEAVSGWNSITNSPPGGGGAATTQWEEWTNPETGQITEPLYFRIENGVHPKVPGMSLRYCPNCDKWFTTEAVCDEGACSSEPTLPYPGYTTLFESSVVAGYSGVRIFEVFSNFLLDEEVPDPYGSFPTYSQAPLISGTLE